MDAPIDLIRAAERCLSVISICDHDTLAAYDHLPADTTVSVLPGVELSSVAGEISVHVLGYFPTGFTDGFRNAVAKLEMERRERVALGVRRLRDRGVPLRWQELEHAIGQGVPCRSHVARALLSSGIARSARAVFARYLRGDEFPKPELAARDAIELILAEGGVPVWAHPPVAQLESVGEELVRVGLAGLEAHVPGSRSRRRTLLEFAARHDLMTTGGTDHHGLSPRRRLGWFVVPQELYPPELVVHDGGASDQRAAPTP